ncbi:enoyl-CoA hydratase/isomerase family protein, partial [Burkholderia stabilis]
MNSTASPDTPGFGTVTRERRDKVLVVTIDHPPVNALSADVRRGLADALDAAQADDAIRAVLIVGAGRNFIAGADIREFGKPPVPPSL